MTGLEVYEKVAEARKELDSFNLAMAQYRVGVGMSNELRLLYRRMGELDYALWQAEVLADMKKLVADLLNTKVGDKK